MSRKIKPPSGRKASRHSRHNAAGPEFQAGGPVGFTDPEALRACLAQVLRQANRPLDMDAILRISKLPRRAKKKIEAALFSLQEEGQALRGGTGWSSPARLRHMEGVLSVQRAGMGFVTPGHKAGQDIYIHPAAMNGAWHGDTVEVLVLPGRRGPSPEGRIVKVLHRAQKEVPVNALNLQRQGQWLCVPLNQRIPALFVADVTGLEKAVRKDDLLLVRPGAQIGPNLWEAEATVNLEQEQSPEAQERLVKSRYAIPDAFPQPVLERAGRYPEHPSERDFTGRRDIRDCPFVTIDGRRARDFDDAVHVEKLADGYRLRVAIADVSHYVGSGSPLDAEARLRGNSYYFPLSVEPMLPEALSNGLCSLKPDVPRLAMTADMKFSLQGQRLSAEFYPAVICSRARLTYGQIERGLLLGQEEERRNLGHSLPMLGQAEELARLLMSLRLQRGSLDFDIPEAEPVFDEQGDIVALGPRKRHFGHRMIEEFMIAANEAVAEFLEQRGEGTLYRVHEPPDPDKVRSLLDYLAASGLDGQGRGASRRDGKKPLTARGIARLLREVKGTPQEYTVNRLLLRSMMQARYEPDNEGHFGLASACYCHFTSPIRRYADLVVHRSLKHALGLPLSGDPPDQPPDSGAAKPLTRSRLTGIAEHINETERTAADAEREMDKRLAVLFLQGREGESFDGVVSGLTEFGIFVELPSVMAEGMLRLAELTDDFYQYLPDKQEIRGSGSRRTFRLGQPIRVMLLGVHLERQEISLALAENESGGISLPGSGGRRRKQPARRSVSRK